MPEQVGTHTHTQGPVDLPPRGGAAVTPSSLWQQIVIHALQCTHYVILWNLAKVSEGHNSRKVSPLSPSSHHLTPVTPGSHLPHRTELLADLL